MYVQRINNIEQLLPYRQRWDELAGECVFRTSIWLTTWWHHYGHSKPGCDLAVFLVFNQSAPSKCHAQDATADCSSAPNIENLVAILPGYFQQTFTQGTALRLLGDGEVCSDHLNLLVAEEHSQQAAKTLADYLVLHSADWDVADFTSVDAGNAGLNHLLDELQSRDCRITRSAGQSCWSVELPATWEEFLALQSKSHRKQLRRADKRILSSDQAIWHLVQTPEQFDEAWGIFIDLHQRRRISLNEPGCFASESWATFHRDVARRLLEAGQLRLSWIELTGKPIAVEYNFASRRTTLAYQSGLDPDRLDEGPGQLSLICAIQHAIGEEHATFDFLRGDEPYKAHWRATPHDTFNVQIVPARSAARLRFQVRNYLRQAGRLARQVTNLLS
ncbi:MAG: GNAT family N-acetyltransferase [Planctomycetes bacterium]|nr:GNAT family N-acetyltransferase [Planctomycetota bacterium]